MPFFLHFFYRLLNNDGNFSWLRGTVFTLINETILDEDNLLAIS